MSYPLTLPNLLLHALVGAVVCAVLAFALALLFDNRPVRSAVVAFFFGGFVQPALVVVAVALGWWR